MEPAEEAELQKSQQQKQNDYAKKVNEMQKFIPCLEQRIENATQQQNKNENEEAELKKLQLLRQVLCGGEGQQEAVNNDSLTLGDLEKYALILKNDTATTKTHTTLKSSDELDNHDDIKDDDQCTKENISINGISTDSNHENAPKVSDSCDAPKARNKSNEIKANVSENQQKILMHENKEYVDKQPTHKIDNKVQNNDGEDDKSKDGNTPNAIQNISLQSDFGASDDLEEIEYEGVELIKIPEECAEDEMILPDSADDSEFSGDEKSEGEEEVEEGEEEVELEGKEQVSGDKKPFGKAEKQKRDATEDEQDKEHEDKEEQQDWYAEDQEVASKNAQNEMQHTVHNEDSGDSVISIQEQEDLTQASESSRSRRDTDDDNSKDDDTNENDKAFTPNDVCEVVEAVELAQCIIEEEESNSFQAERAVEMDNSRNENTPDHNNCDDPLGQEEDTAPKHPDVAEREEADSQDAVSKETDSQDDESQASNSKEALSHKKNTEIVESTNERGNKAPMEIQRKKQSKSSHEFAKTNKNQNADVHDDDDDEVEIIETRNSPICLDTDDEAENTTEGIATIETDKAFPITRTQALNMTKQLTKTTSTVSRPGVSVRTNNPVTETIDLLDSSDEESNKISKRPNKTNNLTLTRSLVRMPTQLSMSGKKRTLLPRANNAKPMKISQVLSGTAVPANFRAYSTSNTATTASRSTTSGTSITGKNAKNVLLFPPTSFKPTPQSNFLNAVNLLPTAATTGDNPLAFSATLWNKNIIIPNAFYANRRTEKEAEKATTTTTTTSNAAAPTSSAPYPSSSSSSLTSTTFTTAKNSYFTSPLSSSSRVQTITVSQQQERVYHEWLDEFIENFANPQQIASHSCLVLLQSVLKYKSFARIKDLRTTLNNRAYSSNNIADGQLVRELRHNFYTLECRLTSEGFRFCAAACSQITNNVTLMTDARTGRITIRTCPYDELLAKYGMTNGGSSGSGIIYDDKRKRHKGDEEYTPAKYYEKKVEQVDGNKRQSERRKSLRQHRTPRCYDETYLYEQEDVEGDDAPPVVERTAVNSNKRRQEAQMLDLVQRKAEEKRLEAKRQREQQVKSFESAYLEMFANSLAGKKINGSKGVVKAPTDNSESTASSSNDATTATNTQQIIIDDDDDEACFEDGEPRSHRIYKVVPTRLLSASKVHSPNVDDEDESSDYMNPNTPPQQTTNKAKRGRPRKQDLSNLKTQSHQDTTNEDPDLITCDSTSGDDDTLSGEGEDQQKPGSNEKVPKNTNSAWHASNEWCRLCNKRIPRTIAHYVNEHPKYEVYNARIQKTHLARLRKQGGQLLQLRPYMNGQEQYAAECVFCNKKCCFKIAYWYQHYSMHTGEYAFRCSGCNARKPTRSAMMLHINQPCRKRGKLLEDYTYNPRAKYIEVRICKLCNYTQLNRRNVLKHLRTQHGSAHMQKKNIESIVLLRMPEPEVDEMLEDAKEFMDLSSGGEDDNRSNQMAMTFNYDSLGDDQQLGDGGGMMMWDDACDPTDDLSYMICGMLDVEMRHD